MTLPPSSSRSGAPNDPPTGPKFLFKGSEQLDRTSDWGKTFLSLSSSNGDRDGSSQCPSPSDPRSHTTDDRFPMSSRPSAERPHPYSSNVDERRIARDPNHSSPGTQPGQTPGPSPLRQVTPPQRPVLPKDKRHIAVPPLSSRTNMLNKGGLGNDSGSRNRSGSGSGVKEKIVKPPAVRCNENRIGETVEPPVSPRYKDSHSGTPKDSSGPRRPSNAPPAESEYIEGVPLACLIVGLMCSVFLISIDRTIISTAIPFITEEFKSTPDIGWYGSAYLLTACSFQPVFGRVFLLFSVKWSFLLAIFIFMMGSLMCAVAHNSMTLIIGRAVAGFGSAGILTGSFVIVAKAVPLRLRPVFMSVVGIMFGVGASVGPLLGGVFTDMVTWRWCFYVNLPISGAVVLAMVLFYKPTQHNHADRTIRARLMDLDVVGNVLLLGGFIMLFLALERSAVGVPWRSQEIIGLLAGSGVGGILFVCWQLYKGDDALMPPRIIGQRTVASCCGLGFLTYGAIINLTYFLPVWFQAIHGDSAIVSGVSMIPYFATNAAFSLVAGYLVSRIGYVTPPAVIGSAIGTVGLGLLTLLNVDTTTAQWVGFEILTSAGFGLSIQQCFTGVQTVLNRDDMPIGTAAVIAAQSLGGSIFLTVGNSVFQNMLLQASAADRLPGVDIKRFIDAGASAFRKHVPEEQLRDILIVYNDALRMVFLIGVPLGAMAAIVSCFIEFKSVKLAPPGDEEEKDARNNRVLIRGSVS